MSQGRVFKRGRGYWISYRHIGQEYRESVAQLVGKRAKETTRHDAVDALRKRLGQSVAGTFSGPGADRTRLAGLLEDYVKSLTLRGRMKRPRETLSHVDHLIQAFGNVRMRELTAPRIRAWAKRTHDAGYAIGTVQTRLGFLRAALNEAAREGRIQQVPAFPRLHVNNARQGFFERDEALRVIGFLPDPANDIARWAYETGWRKAEVLGLTWAMVERESGLIRLPETKNGEGRVVPLRGVLLEIVERRWRQRVVGNAIVPWVFHRTGRRVKDMDKAWRRACRKAGVAGKLFHDFRRTAARDLVEAGLDYQAAMSVTGHKCTSVFQRYRIVDTRTTARAIEQLQAYRHGKADGGQVVMLKARGQT
jgi:integrase